MRKRTREIRDRFWLKVHRFAITNSLKAKLASQIELTDREQEFCCYIQNKVLRQTRKEPSNFANVGATYWEDKIGSGYRRWIDLLVEWGELMVNKNEVTGKEIYSTGTPTKEGFPKSYRIPCAARDSGTTKIDFKRRATPIKDHTKLMDADDIIRFVHRSCSLLTVPKELVEILDPIRDSMAHEFSRRVYWGDFNIRYGDHGQRLYHSIIEMPRDARANLMFKDEGRPLFEYDIKSCHPVLLLPLFSDPLEKAKYIHLLDHDIYTTIRDVMGVIMSRDELKIQFCVCTYALDRYVTGRKGLVYRFFEKHFPIFTREVLNIRSDLAVYLQQQESNIMVQQLGQFCIEKGLFWIPCHDGWMGIEDEEEQIFQKVTEAFFQATGYQVQFKKMGAGGGNNISVKVHIPSYVRIERTFAEPVYENSAEEWFAELPRRVEPDAEVLNKGIEARQRRHKAYQDKTRREREAQKLAAKFRPYWDKLKGHPNRN